MANSNNRSRRGSARRRPSYTTGASRRRNRRQLLVLFLFLGIILAGYAFSRCREQHINDVAVPGHYPDLERVTGAPASSVEKDYEGFRLSFNPQNKTPDWVAWELLGVETDGPFSRGNKFHQDREMLGCPDTKEYSNSGYDRGHLCPAADQKWSSKAMSDCFYMTNMAPQVHELNAGAWKTLEEKERIWAQRDSAIIIVAGPIYSAADNKRIGQAGVRVPGGFFKCLLAPYAPQPRAIAFVYDNARCPGNMSSYACSVDEVEELTGFDFFSSLPDEIEDKVESVYSFTEWNQ